MNNKKIFSVRMCTQTFLQVKAFGIISTIIAVCISLFPKIANLAVMKRLYSDNSFTKAITVNGLDTTLTLSWTFMLLTPILTFVVWSFLNKRSSSDFYHALPYTRECLFLSKFTSIVIWQIIYTWIPYLLLVIFYATNTRWYTVSYKSMAVMTLMIFICNVCVAAACSLASAIGGNTFSNICITGFILFFLRIFLSLAYSVVADITYVFAGDKFSSILDDRYNLVFSLTENAVGYIDNYDELAYNPGSYIYTIILTVVMIVLACVLFKLRKSETAGRLASGKAAPLVIKTLIGFVFSSLGVFYAIEMYYNQDMNIRFEMFYLVGLMFVIAAIAICVFEFIVSRRMSSVRSCVPAIISSYVLALVTGVVILIAINNVMSYKPDASDVKYVTFTLGSSIYGDSEEDYFANITNTIHMDDETIKGIFTDALKSNIDQVNKIHSGASENYYYSGKYTSYSVYFSNGWGGRYRTVYLTNEQVQKVASSLMNNSAYREAYMTLPSSDEVTVYLWDTANDISSEDCASLYNTYLDEVSKMTFSDWYMLVNIEDDYETVMEVTFEKKGVTYDCRFKINTMTPKTLEQYIEINNSLVKKSEAEYIDILEKMMLADVKSSTNYNYSSDDDYDGNYYYLEIEDLASGLSYECQADDYSYILRGSGVDINTVIADVIANLKKQDVAIDVNKPLIKLYGCVYDDALDSWQGFTIYAQPDGYDDISDYMPDWEEYMY